MEWAQRIKQSRNTKNVRVPHIRIFAPAVVPNLTISDYHRTENATATDNILVEKGATVECLSVSNATLFNQANGTISFLRNQGTINALHLSNVFLKRDENAMATLLISDGKSTLLGKQTSMSTFKKKETDKIS